MSELELSALTSAGASRADYARIAKVRALVAKKVADPDLPIERERRQEESEHHAREQRFEQETSTHEPGRA